MDDEDRDLQAVKARFDALAHRYDKTLQTPSSSLLIFYSLRSGISIPHRRTVSTSWF